MNSNSNGNTESTQWLDRPEAVTTLWKFFALVLVLTVVIEFAVTLHPHFKIEAFPAFNAIFGFLSCIVMIVVAKILAIWLKRPDTYYDALEDGDE